MNCLKNNKPGPNPMPMIEIGRKTRFTGFQREFICCSLALIVLSISLPFYAFNRSGDSPVSYYASAFFTSHLSLGSSWMAPLKQFPMLNDGLPSGIWCFSWTLLLLVLWGRENHYERLFWCSLPILVNTGWEGLQRLGILSEGASWTDCMAGLIGAALALNVYVVLYWRK